MALYQSELIKVLKCLNTHMETGGSILMLGVQKILIDKESFETTIKRIGIPYDEEKWRKIASDSKKEIDTFSLFEAFGYDDVHALDISDYEGADILMNLNDEIETEHREFDFVMNIGTLEHVYNVAVAMNNIVKLTKKDGCILNIGPAAGYVDHGFFSFSPTFFEDYFTDNGCSVLDIFLELIHDKTDYEKWRSYYTEDCRLFESWEGEMGIQVYLDRICKMDDIGRVQIWCLAKKNMITEFKNPIQRIYR